MVKSLRRIIFYFFPLFKTRLMVMKLVSTQTNLSKVKESFINMFYILYFYNERFFCILDIPITSRLVGRWQLSLILKNNWLFVGKRGNSCIIREPFPASGNSIRLCAKLEFHKNSSYVNLLTKCLFLQVKLSYML